LLSLLVIISFISILVEAKSNGSHVIRQIGNQIVEENEIIKIDFGQYFQGQLLDYRVYV